MIKWKEYKPMEEGDEVDLDFDESDFEEAEDLFGGEEILNLDDDSDDDLEHDAARLVTKR